MNNRKGFTLIELMIVLTIIAALSAILIPVGVSALYRAKATRELNAVRELFSAESVYYLDQGETADIDGLDNYLPSEWIADNKVKYTEWATGVNTVTFTLNLGDERISKAFDAVFKDSGHSSALLYNENKDIRITFEF